MRSLPQSVRLEPSRSCRPRQPGRTAIAAIEGSPRAMSNVTGVPSTRRPDLEALSRRVKDAGFDVRFQRNPSERSVGEWFGLPDRNGAHLWVRQARDPGFDLHDPAGQVWGESYLGCVALEWHYLWLEWRDHETAVDVLRVIAVHLVPPFVVSAGGVLVSDRGLDGFLAGGPDRRLDDMAPAGLPEGSFWVLEDPQLD